ncbi:MAG: VOC family protein [Nocardioidaceae bacterium]
MTDQHESFVPPDGHVLTPYICVRDATKALDWYADVFGATETMGRFVDPDGRIGHAAFEIGGTHLMLSDAHPGSGAVAPERGNTTANYALHIYVPDVDATVRAAEEAGAVVQREPEDQFYGARLGVFVDPFGVRWMVATHVRDVSQDDIEKRAADYSGAS